MATRRILIRKSRLLHDLNITQTNNSFSLHDAQGGISRRAKTIDCEYLAYFEPKNENYKRDIVRLFLRKLQYFKIILDFIFATENIKKDPKKLLIIGPQFF